MENQKQKTKRSFINASGFGRSQSDKILQTAKHQRKQKAKHSKSE